MTDRYFRDLVIEDGRVVSGIEYFPHEPNRQSMPISRGNNGIVFNLPADPASSEGADAERNESTKNTLTAYKEFAETFDAIVAARDAEIATLRAKIRWFEDRSEEAVTIARERDMHEEEIATLRAALDPFADCVNEGWAPDELKDDDVVMVRVKHHQGYTLKVSDFRRAAAIKQAEGK